MADAVIGSLTTSDFTIEGAFFIETGTTDMHFLGKMDSTIEYAIRLDAADANILKLDLFQADNTDRSLTIVTSLSVAGVTANGAWHWLSIRMDYDGAALLTCEIDSVEDTSTDVSTWSGDWRQDVNSIFAIGADGKDGTKAWYGGADHIAIYLKSITDTERLNNYEWWAASIATGAIDGFGTPLSSSFASNDTRTYKFVTSDAPPLPESGILRIVDSINETTTKLKPQSGLASRGGGSITMIDVLGDPNPDAPSVTSEVIATGTYLAKWDARNVMVNKPIRIKNYRMESDGTIDLENGAEVRNYIIESFDSLGNDKWSLRFKDELSRANIGETVWPLPLEGSLRTAIDATQTNIPVDADVIYLDTDTIRIGDELMKVSAVSNIGTGTASLTVGTRGSDIVYTNTLSTTIAVEHDIDDEVFVCDVSDDEDIDLFLARVLTDVNVDPTYINTSDWADEIDDWHPNDKINTLWIESADTFEVLKKVLFYFLLDMWFDVVDLEIKLTAVSQWKLSSTTITEGIEIDYDTVRKKKEEKLRYTRGLVVFDKRNLTTPDTVENFKKGALFKRTELEVDDIYGEPKTRNLGFSSLLSIDAAALLVNRFVSRNVDPESYKWITQEKNLTFKVGAVLNIITDAGVGFSGSKESGRRAQITQINPKYGSLGRTYSVSALSYQAEAESGSEYIITGNVRNLNIHTYIGAPNTAVEITIIFDGASVGSTDTEIPSIIAGNFAVGSKIIIIMANGADLGSKAGAGGKGALARFINNIYLGWPFDGLDGGTVYNAQGVDTDIYFTGSTPSALYPTADGYLRAPNGGSAGFDAIDNGDGSWFSGNGGNAGDGIDGGTGGAAGAAISSGDEVDFGVYGLNGVTPTTWGLDGADNDAIGGLRGKGVVDETATVVFFPTTPAATRYVNGLGDH